MGKFNNTVQLLGNVGRDAELKSAKSGANFAICTLATKDSYKDSKGEWKENTDWHNLTVFGESAERFAKEAKKGALMIVTGKISYNNYEKDGIKHYSNKIVVESVYFTGSTLMKKKQ